MFSLSLKIYLLITMLTLLNDTVSSYILFIIKIVSSA